MLCRASLRLGRPLRRCFAAPGAAAASLKITANKKGTPDSAHFNRRPRKGDDALDLHNLFTAPVWTRSEREQVKFTHRPAAGGVDAASYGAVQLMRTGFDVFSRYFFKVRLGLGSMSEGDWLRRLIFLETVAGVPGMVGGMVRHMHSLRLMRRDHGWIHSLLAEAENERMHLMIVLKLRKPGRLFRAAVIATQSVFLPAFALVYVLCPRLCHRFVGYLEEEAVHTYTVLLQEIDAGRLPLFAASPAPVFAKTYYHLPEDATLRDVFACMRADESHHRDANHHFADLGADETNDFTDHLRNFGPEDRPTGK